MSQVTFGDIATNSIDKSGPSAGAFLYVDISSVDREAKRITEPKQLEFDQAPSRAKQRLRAGDVLVSMTRPNLNAVALVTPDLDGSIGSTGFHVIRSDVVEPKFIYYLVQTRDFIEKMCEKVQGALYPAVRPNDINSYRFLLPPTIEAQQQIVGKIEELLSELDKGIESLKTARGQLEVYRQTVLKHAFEGKLTAHWREENKDKLESPEQLLARIHQKEPIRDRFCACPSWSICSVQEVLALGPSNGRSVKDRSNGFPVLRLTALKSGKIDLTERKPGDWDRSQAEPYLVKEGDFLLSRGNGSKHLVGRGGLVPKHTNEVAFPDTIVRLRVDSTIMLSEFFSLLWDSRFIRDQIEQSARTTAGIYKINQGHIKSFRVPLPSLSEQKVIVNSLEEKLSLTDRQENEIGAALLKAELLRQSILILAFSGRLTT